MDIRIGLTDVQRELSISSDESQDDVLTHINDALTQGQPTLTLTDAKGRKILIRTDRIAYVEVGTTNARSVGFAR